MDESNPVTSLAGRTALVTGASRGIGRAIAIDLAALGAAVGVNYHTNDAAAEATCKTIEANGGRALPVQANVADREALAELQTTVESELGPIDVLVNNAGIGRQRAVSDLTCEEWDAHLATNLTAAFDLTQGVLPGMREREWGRIVNVSSVAARNGGLIGPHYAATKAGLIGLTRSYAGALAGSGVTVNAIAPGLVETDMVRDSSATPEAVPVGQFGAPEDTARVVRTLVTTGYITGQTINIDGGIRFD